MIKSKIIVLFTSYVCNCNCVMCYAWKKQKYSPQLSIEQIDKIFSNRILGRSVEIVNITGGEPTLRLDLLNIIKIIVNRCERLRRIDIPTNGVNTSMVINQIESILAFLLPTDIKLAVTVSLDGIGDVHEKNRGISNIFKNIDDTIREIKEINELWPRFYFGINTTITKLNYNKLQEIKEYALHNNVGINFTLGAISEIGVESVNMKEQFYMGDMEKQEIINFFEKNTSTNMIDKTYSKLVIELLKTGRRKPLCAFKNGKAILIEPDGNTYQCGNFKEFFIGNILKEKFEDIYRKARKIDKDRWKRCVSCESNCYIEEALK